MTARDVSKALGFSPNHSSTIETAEVVLAADRLGPPIEHLQFDPVTADRIEELRNATKLRGWWEAHADLLPDELVAYDGLESIEELSAASMDAQGGVGRRRPSPAMTRPASDRRRLRRSDETRPSNQ